MQGQDQNEINARFFFIIERATTTDACSGVSLIVSIDSRDSYNKNVQKLIFEIETIFVLRAFFLLSFKNKSFCGLK